MSEPVVRTTDLEKTYRSADGPPVEAVRQVSFDIESGEIFGLLGPNGAGKTTTIGMLTTRVRPDGGEAKVLETSVFDHPAKVRSMFGVVTQHNNLDRSLTARENLLFHGRYYGLSGKELIERTNDLLGDMGLTDSASRQVGTFSGGMTQRLKIARALLHRPDIIVLDEPTAGLDPQTRRSLWTTVDELRHGGGAVLLTTHYMEEAETLCDRVAILNEGQNVATDTVPALKERVPAENVVELTVDDEPVRVADAIREMPDVQEVQVIESERKLRIYTHHRPDLSKFFERAERESTITSARLQQASLEDVFLHLTGRDLQTRQ
ncbi:MAG: ATP-binding cassette domain-containing protein [Bradymonadaceae bacterium]